MSRIVLCILILTAPVICSAQSGKVRSHISFEYGGQLPLQDMQERFGANFNVGGQFELLHIPSGWHVGLKGYYMFGGKVKEDVLANLRTPAGDIIGNDRAPAAIFLRERGLFIGAYAGKLFALSESKPSAGFKVSVGAGLLQHNIRIQDDSRSVTQITGDYLKGYDRLTNGLALYTFIGYQHLDPDRRINFLAGFDLTYGFTESRRDIDFSTGMHDGRSRKDGLVGFRVGWILPITTGQDPDEIYY
jgi:hypothetical protein